MIWFYVERKPTTTMETRRFKYNIRLLRAAIEKKHLFARRGYIEIGRGYEHDNIHIILVNKQGMQIYLYIFAYG